MARTDKHRKSTGRRRPSEKSLANLRPFQPGVSGNPKGRPKSKTLSEHYRAKLNEVVPGDPQQRTYGELIASSMVIQAAQGEIAAARELADRTEGRAPQSIALDANLMDWRDLARQAGLSEADVLREARDLFAELATDGGSETGD